MNVIRYWEPETSVLLDIAEIVWGGGTFIYSIGFYNVKLLS